LLQLRRVRRNPTLSRLPATLISIRTDNFFISRPLLH
jgi:hypothetical protein